MDITDSSSINVERFTARREALRLLLREKGLDALIVSLDANRFYLSGFELQDHQVNESAGCLVIRAKGPDTLCTDARYHAAACRLWDADQVFIYGADSADAIAAMIKKSLPSGAVTGFEARIVNVALYQRLALALRLEPADGLVEQLRIIKDADEIARIEKAVGINHALMAWLPSVIPGAEDEETLAWGIERFFRESGASSLSFPSIVAVGKNAALPHAIPGKTPIAEEHCVLVDVGCRVDDYCSDQTRTFWLGAKPPACFLDTMDQVRSAQEKAIAMIGPGVAASAVYAAAWDYFKAKGVEKFFTHGLGHGVGLQTHEGPSLNPRSQVVLEPGMVVTVEPGLYYPEWGGVRWEYMVLVTEDGHRVL
ncbi:Xaa-Pro peptidase family protein [Desulfovibrio sp. OttesenSCG-928-I05]|nr:Xaa-Pro peptidase family protein [Desulfovibrio sp. OttesenSCG-928-I05]